MTCRSFGFVYHSNNIQKSGEVPEVRINYDILPYTMQFAFRSDPFFHLSPSLPSLPPFFSTLFFLISSLPPFSPYISSSLLTFLLPFPSQPSPSPRLSLPFPFSLRPDIFVQARHAL